MLVKRIGELFSHESRRLTSIDVDDYVGVKIENENAIVTFGTKKEIQFYR